MEIMRLIVIKYFNRLTALVLSRESRHFESLKITHSVTLTLKYQCILVHVGTGRTAQRAGNLSCLIYCNTHWGIFCLNILTKLHIYPLNQPESHTYIHRAFLCWRCLKLAMKFVHIKKKFSHASLTLHDESFRKEISKKTPVNTLNIITPLILFKSSHSQF